MPFSQSSQLSVIMGYVESLLPRSILDVGTGMGQYGFLIRNNLENIDLFDIDGPVASQTPKDDWRIVVDGIEGCPIYRTPVHDYVYNNIYWDDAMTAMSLIADNNYDLVIAIDILEHFETRQGIDFLSEIKRICRLSALVSTPKIFTQQVVEANPYENHRSVWIKEQLVTAGFARELGNKESIIMIYESAGSVL